MTDELKCRDEFEAFMRWLNPTTNLHRFVYQPRGYKTKTVSNAWDIWETAIAAWNRRTSNMSTAASEIDMSQQRVDQVRAEAPIRMERAQGSTMTEFRANLSNDLYAVGDCILCWVNEGDFVMATMPALATKPAQEGDHV